jgi:hypothetical protein
VRETATFLEVNDSGVPGTTEGGLVDETNVPVGAAVQAVFAARGYQMTIEEARRFTELMIDLINRGLIVPICGEGPQTRRDEGV